MSEAAQAEEEELEEEIQKANALVCNVTPKAKKSGQPSSSSSPSSSAQSQFRRGWHLRGEGWTAPLNERLFMAAASGQYKEVEVLVAMGGNLNYPTPLHSGVCCLFAAIQSRNALENASVLVRLGAQINIVDWDGNTPIFAAIQYGIQHNRPELPELVRLFLKNAGSTINSAYNPGYHTPLQMSVFRKKSDVALMLLNAGAVVHDINAVYSVSCHSGQEKVAEALMPALAGVMWSGETTRRYFFDAVLRNRLAFAETMLDKIPDLNVNTMTAGGGHAALHVATQENNEAAVRMLLRRGADPEIKLRGHTTPLVMACHFNHVAIFCVLLGANPSRENIKAAFSAARQKKRDECMQAMLDSGLLAMEDLLPLREISFAPPDRR